MLKQHALLPLFQKFITSCKTGKRLKKDGSRIKPQTIVNYVHCQKLIVDYTIEMEIELIIYEVRGNNKREHIMLKKYWGDFYRQFTEYLYNKKKCYDNYTGQNIKMIRTFFNWLNESYGICTGHYHKSFYVVKEEIPILTLTVEQLQYLVFNKAFEDTLSKPLQNCKDIFVIGCMVGLRYSDLSKIKLKNIEERDGCRYLKVRSKKTGIDTLVKLPGHAIEIINKYKKNKASLLPTISLFGFNKNIKKIGELAGWVMPISKIRARKGITREIFNPNKQPVRFCDEMSSHTMRRTCITTMLTSGMPEYIVRKISGHTSDSKEFFRYVNLAQSLMDKEIEKMHKHFEHPDKNNAL